MFIESFSRPPVLLEVIPFGFLLYFFLFALFCCFGCYWNSFKVFFVPFVIWFANTRMQSHWLWSCFWSKRRIKCQKQSQTSNHWLKKKPTTQRAANQWNKSKTMRVWMTIDFARQSEGGGKSWSFDCSIKSNTGSQQEIYLLNPPISQRW